MVEPISRRNSLSEELKSQISSRRSSAASSAVSTSRRQSGSSLIMSRRGSYSVVKEEEAEEREAESPKGAADLEVTLRQKLEEQNKVRKARSTLE